MNLGCKYFTPTYQKLALKNDFFCDFFCWLIRPDCIYSDVLKPGMQSVSHPEEKISFHIQFWMLFGPIVCLINYFAIFPNSYFSSISLSCLFLIALLLCWKWKFQGFVISLLILLGFMLYHFRSIPHEQWMLYLTMNLSLATAFFIVSLSYSEANDLIAIFHEEKGMLRENVIQLDKQVIQTSKKLEDQKEELHSQICSLTKDIAIREDQWKQDRNDVVNLSQQLQLTEENQKKLHQELQEKQNQLFFLEEQLDLQQKQKNQQTNHTNITSQLEQEIQSLRESLNQRDQEIFNLQFRLNSALEDTKSSIKKIEEQVQEIEHLQEINLIHAQFSQEAQEEQILQEAIQEEMSERIDTLSREKTLLEETLIRLEKELEEVNLDQEKQNAEFDRILQSSKLKEDELAHYIDKNLKAEQQYLSVCQQLQETEKKLEEIKQQPVSHHQVLQDEIKSRKKVEGMYQQLRLQFEQKSDELDSARKKLFHVQEMLTHEHQEREEKELFAFNDSEEKLIKDILNQEQEMKTILIEQELEIEQLYALINQLNFLLHRSNL